MNGQVLPSEPKVTIVVVPRERYGVAQRSLESLFAETPEPYELIVVSSAAPRVLTEWIDAQAKARGFTHINEPNQITPNEARNRGARAARTPYIVFADNDVIYAPGWLAPLVDCAEETGAAVVAPLTCHGEPVHTIIHQAGGEFAPDPAAFFATAKGEREVVERMPLQGDAVAQTPLERGPTQACEFHCTLVRRSALEEIGGLDEGMLATKEHLDFCMDVMARGGLVMFEPASIVTYLFPNRAAPIAPSDWPFFLVRWSPDWQRRSYAHFAQKWGLKPSGYLEERAEKLYWRHYEGVVKPQLRRLPLVQSNKALSDLAGRVIFAATRFASKTLTRRADRVRARAG